MLTIKYIQWNWFQTEQGPRCDSHTVGQMTPWGTVISIDERVKKNKLVYIVKFSTGTERLIYNPHEVMKVGKPIVERAGEGDIDTCDDCEKQNAKGIVTKCERTICNECLEKYEVI